MLRGCGFDLDRVIDLGCCLSLLVDDDLFFVGGPIS